MNRIDRLVAIVLLLQSRRVLRAQDIAEHFEMSVRTVYRDLRALEEAGVPLTAEAGIGYSLVQGYHLPPVMFTHEEASALAIGGKFVENMTDPTLRKNMQNALLKIYSVMPRDKQHYLSTMQETTRVIPRLNTQKFANENLICSIQEAIANRKVLRIIYLAGYNQKKTQRKINPLGLIFYADNWHLIAYCRMREDFRDFRLSRIQGLETLEADFMPPRDFELMKYLRTMGEVKNAIEVKVRFPNHLATMLRDREYFGFVDEKQTNEGIVMTFLTDSLEWMTYWLLSYGPHVDIISPDELREKLIETAEAVAARHRQPQFA